MSWKAEVDELERRREWAEAMGGAANVERQHQQQRLTVHERIEGLVDDQSFREVGKLSGNAEYDENGTVTSVTPAPYVMGLAKIAGRDVAVGGEDFTVRGGTSWGAARRKGGQGGFVEDLAHEYRIPLVNLIDGAGGSVTSAKSRGYTSLPGVNPFDRSVELLGEVPVVCAVLGTAAGGPAGRAMLSHWSIMVDGSSQVFAAGPPVVKRSLGVELSKEALGGADITVDKAGSIHNRAKSEAEVFVAIRQFLSYMPSNVWQAPPRGSALDSSERRDPALLDIIPRNRKQPYAMRKLIGMIVDENSSFEIQPTYGKGLVTSLTRFDGHVVGVIANNPMVYGGAMDAAAARKQIHFMELCDAFHIPIVFLVDVPGFMVGVKAESEGTLREGMRAVYVAGQLEVPVLTIVIRKCYGMAGMATTKKNALDWKLAWPSAEWGSLPVEGGVAAAYRRDIEAAADPKAREAELEAELRAYASPFRTAEAFAVEDVIDPRETRPVICRFAALAHQRLATQLGPKHKSGVRP